MRGAARHGRGLLIAAGLAGGLCVPGGAASAQEEPLEVGRLRFEGSAHFSPGQLATAIVTRATRCRSAFVKPLCLLGVGLERQTFDEAVLRADVLRLRLFYHQHGFRQAVVAAAVDTVGNGVEVTVRITEGPPVVLRGLSIEVPAGIGPGSLGRDLPLAPGAPFSTVAYEASRDTIAARLRNAGYPHAQVLASYLIPVDSPLVATATYEVIPGVQVRFGAVQVEGTEAVASSVVRRRLDFRPGDLYRESALLESQRNLFGTKLFRHVDVRATPASELDSLVPVTIRVAEGDLHRVRVGVGLNTVDAASAEARWVSRNFLGGARGLELTARLSNVLARQLGELNLGDFQLFDTGTGIYGELSGAVSADFTQPWFINARNTLGLGLSIERRSLPDVFVRTTRGGYVSFVHLLRRNTTTVAASYRPELTRLQAQGNLLFCVSFVACAFEDLQTLERPHWLAPVGLAIVDDRSNALFAPTTGHVVRLEAEYASDVTGSEFAYYRVVAEGSLYREVAPGVVLAARLRPGWARAAGAPGDSGSLGLHPQKRFFAGGPNSVRGFPQYQLGPKVLTVNAARTLAAATADGGAGCAPEAINDGTCDPAVLQPRQFIVRPVGGALLFEGNFELRFPVFREKLRGAAFVDFGQVWSLADAVDLGDVLRQVTWTPGVGIRYFSPIGPIRVDVGYNAGGAELLPVITTTVCVRQPDDSCIEPGPGADPAALDNTQTLRLLDRRVSWDPRGEGSFSLDRFQLHLSIGQAF